METVSEMVSPAIFACNCDGGMSGDFLAIGSILFEMDRWEWRNETGRVATTQLWLARGQMGCRPQ